MDAKLPLVSLITPSLNQSEFLEETILSVLEQDYPRIEYWVIDGGSKDDSLEIIRRYEDRLTGWVTEPDAGQTEAINKGFARAKGQILGWLNSDDRLYPSAVSEAVEYLGSHPEIGLVYGNADYIDEQGQVIGRFPAAQTDYSRLLRGYVHIPQQSAFFRSKIWELVGPLDPSFYFAMDYDLWVRAAALTPIRHHPARWGQFRLHSGSKTLEMAQMCWPEMMRVYERERGGLFSVIRLKYAIRKVLEPLLPLRLHARLWLQQWAMDE